MEQRLVIQKRTLKCIRAIIQGDLEDAFFNIATAVDATAKKHYQGSGGNKSRYCDYLTDVQHELFYIGSLGAINVDLSSRVYFGNPLSKEILALSDAIYRARCTSSHDADEQAIELSFTKENRWGFLPDGRFLIGSGMIMALALLVLSDPVNMPRLDRSALRRFGPVRHGDVVIPDLAICVGGRDRIVGWYRKAWERRRQARSEAKPRTAPQAK